MPLLCEAFGIQHMDSTLAVGLCLVQTHFKCSKLYRAATSKKKQDQGLLARIRLESGPSDMAQTVGIMLS